MICPRGLTLAMVLLLGSAWRSVAQTVVSRNASVRTIYRESVHPIEPYGGFGLEAMRTPISGRVWVDRFGMVHKTDPAGPEPVLAPRRSRTKVNGVPAGRRVSQTASRLPTGSLDWPGARDVILYSPGLRYLSYGGGYGFGPYGSVDCGIMYKGMWLGY
jgi:hypothetical protein